MGGTWASENTDQLAATSAIVRDGNHVAEFEVIGFPDALKDIYEIVCGAPAGKDNDAVQDTGAGDGELERTQSQRPTSFRQLESILMVYILRH
jgi:hypothetical protein